MRKVPLKLAVAGMKLARPVINESGVILRDAGAVLTEEVIAQLSDLGVELIRIEGEPRDAVEAEKSLDQQIADLQARFSRVEKDPLMNKIKGILLQRLREKVKGE
jgi:predicted transcriptional regulator